MFAIYLSPKKTNYYRNYLAIESLCALYMRELRYKGNDNSDVWDEIEIANCVDSCVVK